MALQFQRQIGFDSSQLGELNLYVGGLKLYFGQPKHNWNSNSKTHNALLEKLFPNGDWTGPWAAGLLENINATAFGALYWTNESSRDDLHVFDYANYLTRPTIVERASGFSWGSFFKPNGKMPIQVFQAMRTSVAPPPRGCLLHGYLFWTGNLMRRQPRSIAARPVSALR